MCDIGAGGLDDRLTERPVIILNEVGQVVDGVEEAHPAVISRVVHFHLCGRVVPAQLVRFRQMLGAAWLARPFLHAGS